MATNYYEGMFILDSGRFGANPDAAAEEVAKIIEKVGGKVVTHRPWQDSKLAYPINGHRKGLYYLAFFTADSLSVSDINRIVKLNDNVLRHLILSHEKGLFEQMVEMIGGEAFRAGDSDKEAAKKPAEGDANKPAEGDAKKPADGDAKKPADGDAKKPAEAEAAKEKTEEKTAESTTAAE